MTSIEYETIQPSTPIRASVTRTLFQLVFPVWRLIWRVLPPKHPVRLFNERGAAMIGDDIDEALACRGFGLVATLVVAALLALLLGAEAAFDAADINPIGRVFGL